MTLNGYAVVPSRNHSFTHSLTLAELRWDSAR